MKHELSEVIKKVKLSWDSMSIESLKEIQDLVSELSKQSIEINSDQMLNGVELYKDNEHGFILYAYSEQKDTYRRPHNHGRGWVVYAVVSGEIEMGNYINWIKTDEISNLMLKNSEIIRSGQAKIYYPGEIHDTRCISENAIILRLTSCDLRVEDMEGRMLRFYSGMIC